MDRTRHAAAALLVLTGIGISGCSEPASVPRSDRADAASSPSLEPSPRPSSEPSPEPDRAPLPTVVPEPPRAPDGAPVSPESFGARGDGETDDTAALQQAIDSAASLGAPVELARDRTYVVSRALLLDDGSHLTGSGPSSRLLFTWRYNDDVHDGFYVGNRDQDGGNQDITLTDFAIVGDASGLPAGLNELHREPRVPAIRLRLVDRFRVSGLDIGYAPGISLIHQGSSNGAIVDNRIHHSGRDGINGTWHRRNMRDILVQDNEITKVGDDAIAVIGSPGDLPNRDALPHDILIKDNTIRGWPRNPNGLLLGRGITIMASTRVGVVGNVVDRTHSAGILVAPSTRPFSYDPDTGRPWRSSHVSIVDNVIRDAGRNYDGGPRDRAERVGVLVKESDHVWSVGNTITNPLGRATAFYDCRRCEQGGAR